MCEYSIKLKHNLGLNSIITMWASSHLISFDILLISGVRVHAANLTTAQCRAGVYTNRTMVLSHEVVITTALDSFAY